MNREPLSPEEIQHLIANRLAAKELMIDAAMRGDGIAWAACAMELLASKYGLETSLDYSEQDDEGIL